MTVYAYRFTFDENEDEGSFKPYLTPIIDKEVAEMLVNSVISVKICEVYHGSQKEYLPVYTTNGHLAVLMGVADNNTKFRPKEDTKLLEDKR